MSQTAHGQPSDSEKLLFLRAITAATWDIVRWMVQGNPGLLFIGADRYVTPVMMATDTKRSEIADYLAHSVLQRLREGSVPKDKLYGAIHDLGEAAHTDGGYQGCEALRAKAEPVVVGFLTHADPQIRWVAVSVLSSHWDMPHYAHTFRSMSVDDPDESVRLIALGSVGGCCAIRATAMRAVSSSGSSWTLLSVQLCGNRPMKVSCLCGGGLTPPTGGPVG